MRGSDPFRAAGRRSSPRRSERNLPREDFGDRWLEVMEAVHAAGLRSNATMLYGHVETLESRVDHMRRLRICRTHRGVQSFIRWPSTRRTRRSPRGTRRGSKTCSRCRWRGSTGQLPPHQVVLDHGGTEAGTDLPPLRRGRHRRDVVEEKITHAAGAQADRRCPSPSS